MKIIRVENGKLTPEQTAQVISAWESGGLVVYPTETCYGIGVDATSEAAVSRVMEYKDRPLGKAISVAVPSAERAFELIERNTQAENIAKNFLPGPVTLIGKSKAATDRRLESELGNLGIRIPAYPLMLDVLREYGKPVTATSANMAGQRTPYNAISLVESLPERKKVMIDLVIDAGEIPHNPPSLVVDTTQTNKVYRSGVLSVHDLEGAEVYRADGVGETKKIAADFVRSKATELLKNSRNVTLTFLLQGELGAGKTQFVAGVGEGLGVKKRINSPSYTLLKEYDCKFELNSKDITARIQHADLWRLSEPGSIDELGILVNAGFGLNMIFIEWPENLDQMSQESLARTDLYTVTILKIDENSRRMIFRKGLTT